MYLTLVPGMSLPSALHATHTELAGTVSELSLSRFTACLLMLMYVVFLYFQLVSHKEYFEDEAGGLLRSSTRPTLNLCLLLRASV